MSRPLKRLKFARTSEQMSAEQRALFDEAVDGDIAALDEQLATLQAAPPPGDKGRRRRPSTLRCPAICRGVRCITSPTIHLQLWPGDESA